MRMREDAIRRFYMLSPHVETLFVSDWLGLPSETLNLARSSGSVAKRGRDTTVYHSFSRRRRGESRFLTTIVNVIK
jgi:hypothetical protein